MYSLSIVDRRLPCCGYWVAPYKYQSLVSYEIRSTSLFRCLGGDSTDVGGVSKKQDTNITGSCSDGETNEMGSIRINVLCVSFCQRPGERKSLSRILAYWTRFPEEKPQCKGRKRLAGDSASSNPIE